MKQQLKVDKHTPGKATSPDPAMLVCRRLQSLMAQSPFWHVQVCLGCSEDDML